MAADGPPAAVERFWCYMAGEDGWDRLAPALRARLRATAGTLFGVELGTYELYLPGDEALAAIAVPVRLLVSKDGLPVFAQIAGRVARRLGVDVATAPGTHAAYQSTPTSSQKSPAHFSSGQRGENLERGCARAR